MSARIVAYTYVHADAASFNGAHPIHNATATLGVTLQATPGVTDYVRPTVPVPFYTSSPTGHQLVAWQDALNANVAAGTPWSVDYNPATRQMNITGAVNFRPAIPPNSSTAIWTGLTQDLTSGWATQWSSEVPPAAVAELLAATIEPAEDMARVELHEYRHGRAAAIAWGNHQVHRCVLTFRSENLHLLDPGYLATGRVRIYQVADNETAYSATTPGGYVDGFVIASTDPTEDGDIGELWTVTMLVGVPRG